MLQQIRFIHNVTHFGLGTVERSFLPNVGMTLRVSKGNTQIYIVKHVHIDYCAFKQNDQDYISVYVEEYILLENDLLVK